MEGDSSDKKGKQSGDKMEDGRKVDKCEEAEKIDIRVWEEKTGGEEGARTSAGKRTGVNVRRRRGWRKTENVKDERKEGKTLKGVAKWTGETGDIPALWSW